MGRSPSIQELQQKDEEFRKYISQLEKELESRAESYISQMDRAIQDFYSTNGWKEESYITGTNNQFLHSKEWTMDNVKKLIDAIGISLLGGGKPPDGITITSPTDMGVAIEEIMKWQQFIIGRVFTIVDNILSSFGASTSVGFKSEYRSIPLGNGLHLFITLVTDSYQTQSFFNNEYIHEYIYIYQVKYSAGEAQQQATLQLTSLYEDQIANFTRLLKKILTDLTEGTTTPETYQSKTRIYNDLIAESRKALADLDNKLKAKQADFMLAEYR